ncbi:MAG: type II CAAX endopeptidase family protein [Candidatus Manganitrophaceae bacterium]
MLFYVKRYIWLDLIVTALLGGVGCYGIHFFSIPIKLSFEPVNILLGIISFLILTAWTFFLQWGYAQIRGRAYAKELTESLGKEYSDAWIFQAFFGGVTAAFGEELFFRGFIQGKWGLLAGAIAFGLGHIGKKEIRVISYWSFAHGFWLGLFYYYSGDLLVPMIAHGLFDLGGILYFRLIMEGKLTTL